MSGPVPPAGRPGDTPAAADPTVPDGPRHAHPTGPVSAPPPPAAPAEAPVAPGPPSEPGPPPAPPAAPTAAEETAPERITIRTRGGADPDPDATTEVTPGTPAAGSDTAVLPTPSADTPDTPDTPAADTVPTAPADSPATDSPAMSADAGTAEPLAPEQPLRARDPLLVHLIWEGLLLVLLIGLVVAGLVLFPEFRTAAAARRLLGFAVVLGIPAMAFSLSLRGAVPNIAVVPLGALGGSVFGATVADQGIGAGLVQALALTGIVGLVMAALVVGLRVPAWSAGVAAGLLASGLSLAIAVGPVDGVPDVPAFLTSALPQFLVFAVLSIGTGLLCVIPGVRRTLGAYREDVEWGNRGLLAGFVALAVLVLSSAVAGIGGVLAVLQTQVAGTAGGLGDLLFPLAAVLLGGASTYGRRVGIAGTVLGVLVLVTVRELWLLSGLGSGYAGYGGAMALAGIAAIVGLLATPLVEWAGRRAEARVTT